jgi:hypothetical protein
MTPKLESVRSALLALAKSETVQFVFSGVHLSEMAPLEAKYAPAAAARADLLVELCERNTFISFDRVIEAEIACLLPSEVCAAQILSKNGDWFPDVDDAISPIGKAEIAQAIDSATKGGGLNRPQRREFKRQMLKSSGSRSLMQELLEQQTEAADLTDLIRLYPMRPQDAKVLSRYFLGHATKREAEHAFLESLRDPRWMMRWFLAHHDRMTPITEWLRAPSRTMTTNMREAATAALDAHRLRTTFGDMFQIEILTASGWLTAQDSLLLNVANKLLEHFRPGSPSISEVSLVGDRCPGLSTIVRSLHSSLWDSVGRSPRKLKESDFVDAVHAMYAPYATFFRADNYMSGHIQKYVTRWGTQIVSRLEDLPHQIQRKLESQS